MPKICSNASRLTLSRSPQTRLGEQLVRRRNLALCLVNERPKLGNILSAAINERAQLFGSRAFHAVETPVRRYGCDPRTVPYFRSPGLARLSQTAMESQCHARTLCSEPHLD